MALGAVGRLQRLPVDRVNRTQRLALRHVNLSRQGYGKRNSGGESSNAPVRGHRAPPLWTNTPGRSGNGVGGGRRDTGKAQPTRECLLAGRQYMRHLESGAPGCRRLEGRLSSCAWDTGAVKARPVTVRASIVASDRHTFATGATSAPTCRESRPPSPRLRPSTGVLRRGGRPGFHPCSRVRCRGCVRGVRCAGQPALSRSIAGVTSTRPGRPR